MSLYGGGGSYTDTRICVICNQKFNTHEYEERQICRTCERVAIEQSKIPFKMVPK